MAKKYIVTVNGSKYEVVVEDAGNVAVNTAAPAPEKKAEKAPEAPKAAPAAAPAGGNSVVSPLPGTVLKVAAKQGQAVKKGDLLCVIEAMKMENEIVAPVAGTIKQLLVQKGSTVETDSVLAVIG